MAQTLNAVCMPRVVLPGTLFDTIRCELRAGISCLPGYASQASRGIQPCAERLFGGTALCLQRVGRRSAAMACIGMLKLATLPEVLTFADVLATLRLFHQEFTSAFERLGLLLTEPFGLFKRLFRGAFGCFAGPLPLQLAQIPGAIERIPAVVAQDALAAAGTPCLRRPRTKSAIGESAGRTTPDARRAATACTAAAALS